jgi:hypothetical protein
MPPTTASPPRAQPQPPAAVPPAPEAPKERTDLRVRATKPGFYPDPGQIRARRRNPGDVFTLRFLRHFSPETVDKAGWMEWYNEPTTMVDRGDIPVSTVPNQIQDPSSLGREQPVMVERAGEPKQKVAWPDGPQGSQVPLEPTPANPRP